MNKISRLKQIANIISETRSPLYTLDQIKHAIYKVGVTDYMEISNISKDLRQKLKGQLGNVLALKNIHEVKGGQAHKILFETREGERIETVRMLFHPNDEIHESLCISSQSVGIHYVLVIAIYDLLT